MWIIMMHIAGERITQESVEAHQSIGDISIIPPIDHVDTLARVRVIETEVPFFRGGICPSSRSDESRRPNRRKYQEPNDNIHLSRIEQHEVFTPA